MCKPNCGEKHILRAVTVNFVSRATRASRLKVKMIVQSRGEAHSRCGSEIKVDLGRTKKRRRPDDDARIADARRSARTPLPERGFSQTRQR